MVLHCADISENTDLYCTLEKLTIYSVISGYHSEIIYIQIFVEN